jgi:hypothetical protein
VLQADDGGQFDLKEVGMGGGWRRFWLHRFCQFYWALKPTPQQNQCQINTLSIYSVDA